MRTFNFILAAAISLALAVPTRARQKGGRESAPVVTKGPVKPGVKRRDSPRVKPAKPTTAALSVSVTPPDSTVNLHGSEYRAQNGYVLFEHLSPGTHTLAISRPGYRDREIEVHLRAGDHTPLSVALERLNGFISVSPLVDDTEISIVEVATGKSVGVYPGRVERLELPPGRYQVSVSKQGYVTTGREVVVEPALKTSIEPPLFSLPRPAPARRRPAPPPFSPDYSTRVETSLEGRFVVVTLTGRSGDTAGALGALDVTLSAGGGQVYATNVTGMLTGYPCQVDFVRLENVAEYSFVEPPGAANQWARAVVRLRPKESKRPVHFLINWRSLRATSPMTLSPDSPVN
jgi:PEGA domain